MGSLYELGLMFRPNFRVLGRWMRMKLLKKHNMGGRLLKKYLLVLRRLEELNFSGLRRTPWESGMGVFWFLLSSTFL